MECQFPFCHQEYKVKALMQRESKMEPEHPKQYYCSEHYEQHRDEIAKQPDLVMVS